MVVNKAERIKQAVKREKVKNFKEKRHQDLWKFFKFDSL